MREKEKDLTDDKDEREGEGFGEIFASLFWYIYMVDLYLNILSIDP